jgi:[ribosomal protein S5]-alanine N-acetyltransferase
MGSAMPVLETERLIIRPFRLDDMDRIAQVRSTPDADENRRYIEGSIASGEYLASLGQPPYGDRAVVRKADERLIGAAGLVPCLMPFDQLGCFSSGHTPQTVQPNTPEVGLYWELDPDYRRQGYATEAARALIAFAFQTLRLKRIVANTDYDNAASQGVMRKLGMTIDHNLLPEPEWFQVVGILENDMKETQP